MQRRVLACVAMIFQCLKLRFVIVIRKGISDSAN